MKDLYFLAQEIQTNLISRKLKFCFIGGIALQAWGESRLTQDIDLSLYTGFEEEESTIDKIFSFLQPRVEDPIEFALVNRVILAKTKSNIGVDIALAGMEYEAEVIERAVDFRFIDDLSLKICTADDLVVMKAFAGRPKDYLDLRGIIARQGKKLSREAILKRLIPLAELKEEPQLVDKLEQVFTEVSSL